MAVFGVVGAVDLAGHRQREELRDVERFVRVVIVAVVADGQAAWLGADGGDRLDDGIGGGVDHAHRTRARIGDIEPLAVGREHERGGLGADGDVPARRADRAVGGVERNHRDGAAHGVGGVGLAAVGHEGHAAGFGLHRHFGDLAVRVAAHLEEGDAVVVFVGHHQIGVVRGQGQRLRRRGAGEARRAGRGWRWGWAVTAITAAAAAGDEQGSAQRGDQGELRQVRRSAAGRWFRHGVLQKLERVFRRTKGGSWTFAPKCRRADDRPNAGALRFAASRAMTVPASGIATIWSCSAWRPSASWTMDVGAWFAMCGTGGLPAAQAQRLSAAVQAAMKDTGLSVERTAPAGVPWSCSSGRSAGRCPWW